ncbi:helix-turn-helix domain-containing protein [Anaerovibrio sp. RM50]|uniref:helix-turn-helix domain-containing protein n=1 Tax=Anaerovibrio sp. RM50 TaxID=1200557 RepID=UPI0006842A18|nr:helix-turn-helix transcriptional regulator [Anaerovibrio sp. RM50]
MTTFGEKLKRLRVDSKRISLGDAAKELGIPKSTLNNYERNSSKPPLEMLCKLAEFYNTTVDNLVGYEPDPEVVELIAAVKELSPEQRETIKTLVKGLKK